MPKSSMTAILTIGHGGYDQLVASEVPMPEIGPGEVLVKVVAAASREAVVARRLPLARTRRDTKLSMPKNPIPPQASQTHVGGGLRVWVW